MLIFVLSVPILTNVAVGVMPTFVFSVLVHPTVLFALEAPPSATPAIVNVSVGSTFA